MFDYSSCYSFIVRKSLLVFFLSLIILFLICLGISFFSIFFSVNTTFIPGVSSYLPDFSAFFESFIKYLPLSFLFFFPVFYILASIYHPPFTGIVIPLLTITSLFFALIIPFSFFFKTETGENYNKNTLNPIDYEFSRFVKTDNVMVFWNKIENNTLENVIILTPETEPPLKKFDSLTIEDLSPYGLTLADFRLSNDSSFNREKMIFFDKIQSNFFNKIITLTDNLRVSFTKGFFSYILISIGYFLILSGLWPFAFFSSWKLLDFLFVIFGFISSIYLLNLIYSESFINYLSSKNPVIKIPELYSLIFSVLIFIVLQIFGFFVILTHRNRKGEKQDEN